MHIFRITLCTIFLGLQSLSAQDHPVNMDVIPNSPNAMSLATFKEVPVVNHTGKINYSIPIHTITVGNLSIPISMSYSSSGLKVDETPSWVGLGWTLNAGGAITRELRGLPDESANGFNGYNNIGEKFLSYVNGTMSSEERRTYEYNIANGDWDSQPDVFHFNTGILSGKFVYDAQEQYHFIPFNKYSVERTIATDRITQWNIRDFQGNRYVFNKPEETVSENITSGFVHIFQSSWYLSRIELANGQRIEFYYEGISQAMPRTISHTKLYPKYNTRFKSDCPDESVTTTVMYTDITGWQLKKISYPGGHVEFNKGPKRLDINGTNSHVLDNISVYAKYQSTNKLIKKFTFNYGYYNPSGSVLDRRLFLQRIAEEGIGNYDFEYYSGIVPTRDISKFAYYQQDHWGYYNESGSRKTILVPSISYIDNGFYYYKPGADRSPNWEKSRNGTLKSVTLPLGGQIKFTYEGNEVNFDENNDLCDLNLKGEFSQVSILNNHKNDLYVSKTFNIEQAHCININYTLYAKDASYEGEGSSRFEILKNGQTIYQESLLSTSSGATKSDQLDVFLERGEYTLKTFAEEIGATCYVDVKLKYLDGDDPTARLEVGGIRIKKIEYCPDENTDCITRRYNYYYDDYGTNAVSSKTTPVGTPDLPSTGRLIIEPIYLYNHSMLVTYVIGKKPSLDQPTFPDEVQCNYYAISSSSASSFTTDHIMYDMITVYQGEYGEYGKTVYKYYNEGYSGSRNFPFPPENDVSFRRGELKTKEIYRREGEDFILIQKDNMAYKHSDHADHNFLFARGLKAGFVQKSVYFGSAQTVIKADMYSDFSAWDYLLSQQSTHFTPSGTISRTTQYFYENPHHIQITRTETDLSSNQTSIQIIKYPHDYETSSGYVIHELKSKNHINFPIEKQEWVKHKGQLLLVKSVYYKYAKINDTYLPVEIHTLETDKPINDFEKSDDGSRPIIDPRFVLSATLRYSPLGRLIEKNERNGISTAYQWDSDGLVLEMQAVGAKRNEIRFLNFNNEENGYVSNSLLLNHYVPQANNTYLVDYDYYENGSWVYHTPIAYYQGLELNHDRIDNVRIFPRGSMATSYLYSDRYLLEVIIDQNGQKNTYSYDDQSRLELIMDTFGNKVQSFNYNTGNR